MSDIVKDLRDYINNTSDVQLRVIAANEIESLRQQLSDAQREAAHWKNNHDTEVRRARILKERTDMPIERVQAYERWCLDLAENAALRQQLASIKRPDFREMREMLRAMQAGELTVSRGIEILEIWSAGNWNDDMLPPVRQDLIEEDSIPVEIIDRLRQQLAEANVEIERLKAEERSHNMEYGDVHDSYTEASLKLAASQAREQELRGAFQTYIDEHEECTDADDWMAMTCSMEAHHVADEALAQPADTTALQAMIAKAGEVMRERCAKACTDRSAETDADDFDEWDQSNYSCAEAIHALPGVTLEDLK